MRTPRSSFALLFVVALPAAPVAAQIGPAGSQFWHAGSDGLVSVAEEGALFGHATAAGDFIFPSASTAWRRTSQSASASAASSEGMAASPMTTSAGTKTRKPIAASGDVFASQKRMAPSTSPSSIIQRNTRASGHCQRFGRSGILRESDLESLQDALARRCSITNSSSRASIFST